MDCATFGDGQSCASDAVATFALFGIRLTIAASPRDITPAQITSAYGLNGISFTSSSGTKVAGDGSGQTIALVEMYSDPNIQAALNVFDAQYNLPNTTLNVINQAGSQTNSGWAQEESLDVEWAHAMAPGAKIDVIEAAPGNTDSQVLANLMTAVQTANHTAGVTVVSMSWGMSEFSNEASYDSNFTTPGITYIASSGDSGAVEWPAASPNVLAVGGTSLQLSSSGVIQSQSGWIDAGGGLSQFESEPSYQDSVQSTGFRSTPDVSFVADPNTGVSVYVISPNSMSDQGQWEEIGGTSVGAPSWAGIIADRRRRPVARRTGEPEHLAGPDNPLFCPLDRLQPSSDHRSGWLRPRFRLRLRPGWIWRQHQHRHQYGLL